MTPHENTFEKKYFFLLNEGLMTFFSFEYLSIISQYWQILWISRVTRLRTANLHNVNTIICKYDWIFKESCELIGKPDWEHQLGTMWTHGTEHSYVFLQNIFKLPVNALIMSIFVIFTMVGNHVNVKGNIFENSEWTLWLWMIFFKQPY